MNQIRIVSADFAELVGIEHTFFTRLIPGSTHIYTRLDAAKSNIADPETVIQANTHIALENLGFNARKLYVTNQTHSTRVATIENLEATPDCDVDAQVTRVPGAALGVLTADCVPVLFADAKNRVIGSAHSGWRGTQNGILEATVARMLALGAKLESIHAVIGPCIRWDSYEVGPEFIDFFVASAPENAKFFKPSTRPDHYLFDLPGVVSQKLKDLRIGSVTDTGLNTYTNPELFFSFRRQTHEGHGFKGNLLSVVMLKP